MSDACCVTEGYTTTIVTVNSLLPTNSLILPIASYGTRTRSNTVTGCRADPHTYEA
jgi:hypothetical protein